MLLFFWGVTAFGAPVAESSEDEEILKDLEFFENLDFLRSAPGGEEAWLLPIDEEVEVEP